MRATDLLPFCAKPWAGRLPLLCAPFTVGNHTYATDGSIIVRTNRMAGVYLVNVTNSGFDAIKWQAACTMVAPRPTDVAVPIHELPPVLFERCDVCEGKGRDGGELCLNCCGAGHFERHQRVDLSGWHYSDYYLRRIQALPKPTFYPRGAAVPAYFTFEGGDGAVMPSKS